MSTFVWKYRGLLASMTKRNADPESHDIEQLRKSAKQRDVNAKCKLGLMYNIGLGLPKDTREAAKWYRLAAEQRHGPAQFNLGVKYQLGEGVPANLKEALKWYRQSAGWYRE